MVGGMISDAVSELSQSIIFDIEENFERQAFVELSGLSKLIIYRVSFNRFTCPIPEGVDLLTQMLVSVKGCDLFFIDYLVVPFWR
jgi:hypothetical protein